METETDSNWRERILDGLNSVPASEDYDVTNCDIFWTITSILSRVFSIFSTIYLAYSYYQRNQIDYVIWTLCCFIIPLIITMFLQIFMYLEDRRTETPNTNDNGSAMDVICFVVICPILLRYWKCLSNAMKSKNAANKLQQKKYHDLLLKEESDVALIRLFECFLETAPQKILQISIILSGEDRISVPQIFSLASSIFSMAWCIASYHRSIRLTQIDKVNLTWIGSIVQSAWHFLVTVSRILSIAIVASLFPSWTLIAFSCHAMAMCCWIFVLDRSPFCSTTMFHSFLFSFILGFVFIFNYILPKERKTRYRFAVFYTICFIENIICVLLYIKHSSLDEKKSYYFLPLCVLSILPFLLGMGFMILYYTKFHPNILNRRTTIS